MRLQRLLKKALHHRTQQLLKKGLQADATWDATALAATLSEAPFADEWPEEQAMRWLRERGALTVAVTDDIHLPFGTLRLRGKGSDGGHNGLKDIQSVLGSSAYPRLRFGVGAEFGPGRQVDHVLGSFSAEEEAAMEERLDKVVGLMHSFAFVGLQRTMSAFNNT